MKKQNKKTSEWAKAPEPSIEVPPTPKKPWVQVLADGLTPFAHEASQDEIERAFKLVTIEDRRMLWNALESYSLRHDPDVERDADPATWSDSRYLSAQKLAQEAALIHLASLHKDLRELHITRAGSIRQCPPSIVKDAIALAKDVREAALSIGFDFNSRPSDRPESAQDTKGGAA